MLSLVLIQNLENMAEFRSLSLEVMTKRDNFVKELNLSSIWSGICSWNLLLAKRERLEDLLIDYSRILALAYCDCKGISITILLLEMSRGSNTHKTAINHDSNFVTECLCFIHAMSCQHYRWILQVFQHFEKTAARNRINSSSWLIEEFNCWIC